MKYAPVVVLVLCAIAVQASVIPADLSKIIDELSKEMEVPITNAKHDIEVVRQNILETAGTVLENFQKADDQSKTKLAEIMAVITEKVLKLKGGAFQTCVDQQQADLDSLKEEAHNEIDDCTEGADQSLVSYRGVIRDDLAEIKEREEELDVIVAQCVEYDVNMADKCVYRRIEEIQNTVNGIMFATRSVTRIALQDAKNAEQCDQAAYEKSVQELEEIQEKVEECYSEN